MNAAVVDALDAPIDLLLVLGSGLSGCFAEDELRLLDASIDVPSASPSTTTPITSQPTAIQDLPTPFAALPMVDGHPGRFAMLERPSGIRILVSLGRRHLYEGVAVAEVQRTVRAAAALGARGVILTNAAGGLRPEMRAGDIMLIEECIGSLLGARAAGLGARPVGFARELHAAIERGALEAGLALRRGVYVGLSGPCYETRAEVRMLRRIGADAVGMSTVAEAAAASELGLRLAGLSLITNVHRETGAAGLEHAEVVEQGMLSVLRMRAALDATIAALERELLPRPSSARITSG